MPGGSRMTTPGPGLRKRVIFLFCCTALAVAVLIGRVFWIQFVQGEELRARAQEVRTRHIPVEARRGVIYDARGRELAISITSDTVVVNPAEVRDPAGTAARLGAVLDMPGDQVLKIITRRTSFEFVRRKIEPDRARAVRALDLPGVYLTQETRRVYPKGRLAANILGFSGMDSQGLEGVEMVYDKQLRGKAGRIVIEYDARNREIPQAVHRYVAPRDGMHMILTVDETIQYITERELDKVMERTQARGAWAVVVDPRSGEILALAQRPSYDPNRAMDFLLHKNPEGRADADPKRWRNMAISDAYPPGSVFKPVTAAMALEDGKVTPDTGFYDRGSLQVPGSTVRNWNGAGLGATNFAEGFEKSANTVFAQVGLRVGMDRFYHYLEKFNLTSPVGVDLPGEGSGIRPPKQDARPLDLALMAFGQTLTVTPMQMLTAIGTIANDGMLIKPHVVKAFVNEEGQVTQPPGAEPRQVISPETARTVRTLMGRVVDEGTGARARIPGYDIGGKTGTSEKVIGGRVSTDRNIASFVGFAPLAEPRVLTYIMVDEPQGLPYGGYVAAPVFEAIMRDVLHYLNVKPTRPVGQEDVIWGMPLPEPPPHVREEGEKVAVPDILNLPLDAAREEVARAGLQMDASGGGLQVLRQVPPAGSQVENGSKVLAFTGPAAGAQGTGATVPDLKGRSLREVASILGALGLRLDAQGSGVAATQMPGPGARLPVGGAVQVTFQPPSVEEQPADGEINNGGTQ